MDEKSKYLGYTVYMKNIKTKLDENLAIIDTNIRTISRRLYSIKANAQGKTKIYISLEELDLLCDVAETLEKASYDALSWNKLLYSNRGKSSFKKKISSAENGKKGGRPPKEISDAKRRVEYLENLDFSERTEELKKEHNELVVKINNWKLSKGIISNYWEWD